MSTAAPTTPPPPPPFPPRNTVRLLPGGPLELRGTLSLRGAPIGAEAKLCRCGRSQDKPHCDGSHHGAGRDLPGEAAASPREAAAAAVLEAEGGGVLEIEPRPNGPVRVTGNLAVLNAEGAVIARVTRTALCRCGESRTKPWCDGTHRRVGFVAP